MKKMSHVVHLALSKSSQRTRQEPNNKEKTEKEIELASSRRPMEFFSVNCSSLPFS
jgi:hypothetical protein